MWLVAVPYCTAVAWKLCFGFRSMDFAPIEGLNLPISNITSLSIHFHQPPPTFYGMWYFLKQALIALNLYGWTMQAQSLLAQWSFRFVRFVSACLTHFYLGKWSASTSTSRSLFYDLFEGSIITVMFTTFFVLSSLLRDFLTNQFVFIENRNDAPARNLRIEEAAFIPPPRPQPTADIRFDNENELTTTAIAHDDVNVSDSQDDLLDNAEEVRAMNLLKPSTSHADSTNDQSNHTSLSPSTEILQINHDANNSIHQSSANFNSNADFDSKTDFNRTDDPPHLMISRDEERISHPFTEAKSPHDNYASTSNFPASTSNDFAIIQPFPELSLTMPLETSSTLPELPSLDAPIVLNVDDIQNLEAHVHLPQDADGIDNDWSTVNDSDSSDEDQEVEDEVEPVELELAPDVDAEGAGLRDLFDLRWHVEHVFTNATCFVFFNAVFTLICLWIPFLIGTFTLTAPEIVFRAKTQFWNSTATINLFNHQNILNADDSTFYHSFMLLISKVLEIGALMITETFRKANQDRTPALPFPPPPPHLHFSAFNGASSTLESPYILMNFLPKISVILIGYGEVVVVMAALLVLTSFCKNSANSAVRTYIHRLFNFSVVSAKLFSLCFIELVLFPIFCGAVMDLCTLPLFFPVSFNDADSRMTSWVPGVAPTSAFASIHTANLTHLLASNLPLLTNSSPTMMTHNTSSDTHNSLSMFLLAIYQPLTTFNVWSALLAPIFQPLVKGIIARLLMHHTSPYASLFLHWLFGMLFMFNSSVFIGMFRSMFRVGVLWYVGVFVLFLLESFLVVLILRIISVYFIRQIILIIVLCQCFLLLFHSFSSCCFSFDDLLLFEY